MTRPPGRWATLPAEATILVVVHTVASLMRVLDYVELVESDPRIRLEWTVAPDRFNVGVTATLAHLGIEPVPWEEALARSYDLALATSLHRVEDVTAKHRFAAPHGCGYGKKYPGWAWPTGQEPPVYGLDRESLWTLRTSRCSAGWFSRTPGTSKPSPNSAPRRRTPAWWRVTSPSTGCWRARLSANDTDWTSVYAGNRRWWRWVPRGVVSRCCGTFPSFP
ncbi:hypothetical protein GCM10029964_015500 [Kibdelosporangium lantanae]